MTLWSHMMLKGDKCVLITWPCLVISPPLFLSKLNFSLTAKDPPSGGLTGCCRVTLLHSVNNSLGFNSCFVTNKEDDSREEKNNNMK